MNGHDLSAIAAMIAAAMALISATMAAIAAHLVQMSIRASRASRLDESTARRTNSASASHADTKAKGGVPA